MYMCVACIIILLLDSTGIEGIKLSIECFNEYYIGCTTEASTGWWQINLLASHGQEWLLTCDYM